MTSLIIILILIVIVSFLLGKLYLLKRQLKNMAAQLQEPGDGFIGVDFHGVGPCRAVEVSAVVNIA